MSNGKGSAPRPLSVSREEFGRRFDAVFRKKKRNTERRSGRRSSMSPSVIRSTVSTNIT